MTLVEILAGAIADDPRFSSVEEALKHYEAQRRSAWIAFVNNPVGLDEPDPARYLHFEVMDAVVGLLYARSGVPCVRVVNGVVV